METKRLIMSAKWIGNTLYQHKIKVILLLGFGYGLKKCYDFYLMIKPFLQLKNQLSQVGLGSTIPGGAGEGQLMSEIEQSPSQKALQKLLSDQPEFK